MQTQLSMKPAGLVAPPGQKCSNEREPEKIMSAESVAKILCSDFKTFKLLYSISVSSLKVGQSDPWRQFATFRHFQIIRLLD